MVSWRWEGWHHDADTFAFAHRHIAVQTGKGVHDAVLGSALLCCSAAVCSQLYHCTSMEISSNTLAILAHFEKCDQFQPE